MIPFFIKALFYRNIPRVIGNFRVMITTLYEGLSGATPDGRYSFDVCIAKLSKYMELMLRNDRICSATVLDSYVREGPRNARCLQSLQ
jgi:hypothetical protein